MEQDLVSLKSLYSGCNFIITTKHNKSIAIQGIFKEILNANVAEYMVDTDQLGTFSGEIARIGSPLDCAKKKCEWGMLESGADYGLASEGSFGSHKLASFFYFGQEILYFIDKKRNFDLYIVESYKETKYQGKVVNSYQELLEFAQIALFPSHALILRAFPLEDGQEIFKGIRDFNTLKYAYQLSIKKSNLKKVLVETDMRAHLNPTRMNQISKAADKLANRLLCLCPQCSTPGWGKIAVEHGLACEQCSLPTLGVKADILGCVKCNYQEKSNFIIHKAKPIYCEHCNP